MEADERCIQTWAMVAIGTVRVRLCFFIRVVAFALKFAGQWPIQAYRSDASRLETQFECDNLPWLDP